MGHKVEDSSSTENEGKKVVTQGASEANSVESASVMFEELMARIRHIVLVNRLRVKLFLKLLMGMQMTKTSNVIQELMNKCNNIIQELMQQCYSRTNEQM